MTNNYQFEAGGALIYLLLLIGLVGFLATALGGGFVSKDYLDQQYPTVSNIIQRTKLPVVILVMVRLASHVLIKHLNFMEMTMACSNRVYIFMNQLFIL